MADDSPIVLVLQQYFPEWNPPTDRGRDWTKCICPAHVESRPSASVSFERGAIKCQACGFSGDVPSIIMGKEGIEFAQAIKRAEEIAGRRYQPVSRKSGRKPSRRVFGQPGIQGIGSGTDRPLPPWLRG